MMDCKHFGEHLAGECRILDREGLEAFIETIRNCKGCEQHYRGSYSWKCGHGFAGTGPAKTAFVATLKLELAEQGYLMTPVEEMFLLGEASLPKA